MEKLLVFIGYDSREDIAYEVCRHSIIRRSSVPVEVIPVKHRKLREQQLFWRPWMVRGDGQMVDCVDGMPFSTEFSHTRFLVPELAKKKVRTGFCLFVDCDFLFLDDFNNLFRLADPQYAVQCRKFQFHPASDKKMDGMVQSSYDKKLWSSMCLWNLDHWGTHALTPTVVNRESGRWLHQFSWLQENNIGELPEAWNCITGDDDVPKAVHYTEGGPWFEGYEKCPYGHLWLQEKEHLRNSL